MTPNKGTRIINLIRLQYFLALAVLLHSLFFLVYGFAVGDFRRTIDAYLAGLIGVNLPYMTFVMVLVAVLFLFTLLRFFGLRSALEKGEWYPRIPDWVFYSLLPLFLIAVYGAFFTLFNQDPSQKGVVYHLLNLTRLASDAILFFVAAVWLRRLILTLRLRMASAQTRWPWTAAITLVLVALVGLWLVPALLPPNWAYQGDLPTKPALIAHRGASMLAPENTLGAVDLAVSHQALGFETDLRISLDGVPFLMHDDTLARTTNIAEVFPEREDDPASSFTLAELKALNAGLWFIQKDPFRTIEGGHVSQSQLSINQGQSIPTLAEALARVREYNMVIMFDMRYPPSDHPFYQDYFEIVLEECIEARMNSQVWFLLDEAHLPLVLERAPQMTRVAGISSTDLPTAEDLLAQEYEIVNVDTGIPTRTIRAYRAEGLGVNVYTIDEPWLFSQFWLSGVTSVTTNNVHTFNQLNRPSLNLSYGRFMLFWALYGITLAIWLASSQPEPEPVEPENAEPPSLSDFDFGPHESVEVIESIRKTDLPANGKALPSQLWTTADAEPDQPDNSEAE
jgi:glycerophosphoryl diester phosphodiesterase